MNWLLKRLCRRKRYEGPFLAVRQAGEVEFIGPGLYEVRGAPTIDVDIRGAIRATILYGEEPEVKE